MNAQDERQASLREQMLEKLILFERALDNFHPERGNGKMELAIQDLRASAEELRKHLATHISPREMIDWYTLPDSDQELTAFAYEMQVEHQEILRALAGLLNTLEEMGTSLDRLETAGRIWGQGRPLAERIARHCAGEETSFGRMP